MIDIDFGFYLQLFLRRLPFFLLVAIAVAAGGTLMVYSLPSVYRATAKILVETPQIPTDLARSTVPTGAAEQFQIIQEDVLSRDNLIEIANDFGVYPAGKRPPDADLVDDMRARISVEPGVIESGAGDSRATIYYVSFDSPDPDLSARVANHLVTLILDKDVELRTSRANGTLQFFTQEVNRLDASVKQVDAQILAFKNAHIDALPDSLEFRRNQQSTLEQQLLDLAKEEGTLRDRQSAIQAGLSTPGSAPASPEEQALAGLRQSLAQQSLVFTPNSPTIRTLQTRIDALVAQISGENSSAPSSAHKAPRSSADIEMDDIKSRLAAIVGERADIEARNSKLDASAAATPDNESALNEFQRNRQTLEAQYEAAVGRLADASTGQQIEVRFKGQRLSLIEAATAPKSRLSPKRPLLLAGTGIAALLLGLAVIILPEFFNRTIRRPVEMVDKLNIRPLVSIPYIERGGWRLRRAAAVFAAIILVGGLIPAVMFVVRPHAPPAQTATGAPDGGVNG